MAVETYEREPADRLWALREVPPFPWTVARLLQMFSGPSADEGVETRPLVELIRGDASLSSELLRRANSPLFGMQTRISSLEHALVLLGLDHVKLLAMTIGLGSYLRCALSVGALRRCWRHSVATGVMAERLGPACAISPGQAYAAGLLHDIGRLALLVKYPQPYSDLLSTVSENRLRLLDTERDLFDIDHCEAGAWLARQWHFPEELAAVMESHHEPGANGPWGIVRLVNVSCRLADSLGFAAVESAAPEDVSQIVSELPAQARFPIGSGLSSLKESLAAKVAALE